MDEELNLDLNENNQEEIISRKDKKINSISEKLKLTSEEKEALAKEKAEAEAKAMAAQKEAEFYKGFNTISSKFPGANEYQDKILEKVNSGYDLEDATISILAKEGKYTPPAPVLERESPAGGSASIGMTDAPDKSAKDMGKEDLKKALAELESKGVKLI